MLGPGTLLVQQDHEEEPGQRCFYMRWNILLNILLTAPTHVEGGEGLLLVDALPALTILTVE